VGLLVGAIDEAGTHLYETCPSGNYYEYTAMAIGDRNQSAKTYLEKNFESFSGADREDMLKHGVRALRASAQDTELTEHNLSVGIVGRGEGNEFKTLSQDEIRELIASVGEAAADGGEQMIVS
jgi:20S proteasome subunit alpha 6